MRPNVRPRHPTADWDSIMEVYFMKNTMMKNLVKTMSIYGEMLNRQFN